MTNEIKFSALQWNIQDGGGAVGTDEVEMRFENFKLTLNAILSECNPQFIILNEFGQHDSLRNAAPLLEPIRRDFQNLYSPVVIRQHTMLVAAKNPSVKFSHKDGGNYVVGAWNCDGQQRRLIPLHIDNKKALQEIKAFDPGVGFIAVGDWNFPCEQNPLKGEYITSEFAEVSHLELFKNEKFNLVQVRPSETRNTDTHANGWYDYFVTDLDDWEWRVTHFHFAFKTKGGQNVADHTPVLIEARA